MHIIQYIFIFYDFKVMFTFVGMYMRMKCPQRPKPMDSPWSRTYMVLGFPSVGTDLGSLATAIYSYLTSHRSSLMSYVFFTCFFCPIELILPIIKVLTDVQTSDSQVWHSGPEPWLSLLRHLRRMFWESGGKADGTPRSWTDKSCLSWNLDSRHATGWSTVTSL